ncbi:MAG TPA: hypothetical protein VG456_10660 [Candidatus Sulfopaludibacter sp.]|jgi:hypothetical protein|nr:hypothetical protein [Candidatus Sulfopaludibacter sp.]
MRSILLAAAVLLLACFSPPFQDDDAWWRLATGRLIVQNHKVPVTDPFDFTTYIGPADADRQSKLAADWMPHAAMYLVYAAGGFVLVVLVRALLLMLACGLTGYAVWRMSRSFYVSLAGVFLPAAACSGFVHDQPAILTFLLVAGAVVLVARRLWWALAPLAVFGWWSGLRYADVPLWTLSPILAYGLAWLPWKVKAPLAARWNWALTILILAAVALPVWQHRAFGFSAWDATRPAGAVRFLEAHHVAGPIFNTLDQGGYLVWQFGPERRVFVDGRRLNQAVVRDAYRIANGVTALPLLDQYGVQAILIQAFDYPTGSPRFLIATLADPNQTQWKLVYQDGEAMVFLRQVPPGVRALPNTAALSSMEAQCAAHIRMVPGEPLCARETCKMYEHLGNLDRARFWLAYYLQHKKQPDPEAEVEYQRLLR